MQCRGTVQQHGMFANHLIQHVPHFRPFLLDQALGTLDCGRRATLLQLVKDKGFKELKCHLLGQSTLMQPKLRPHDNNGSARIIDPFTE